MYKYHLSLYIIVARINRYEHNKLVRPALTKRKSLKIKLNHFKDEKKIRGFCSARFFFSQVTKNFEVLYLILLFLFP